MAWLAGMLAMNLSLEGIVLLLSLFVLAGACLGMRLAEAKRRVEDGSQ